MKKIICILLVAVLLIPMSIGIMAHENEYTFIIHGEEITISGMVSEEEAYEIAYLHYYMENDIEISTSYATCSHNYECQQVIATTHRARVTAPRCQKFLYNIYRCSKCTDTYTQLLSTWYVDCCD